MTEAATTLTRADVLLAAQSLSGRFKPSLDEENALDIDIDSAVTRRDLDLLMQAALSGKALPAALLSTIVHPGAVVRVVSPELIPLGASYRIQLDGAEVKTVLRTLPGYATLLLPSTQGTGDRQLEIYRDNQLVDAVSIRITASQTPTVPAAQDIKAFFSEWAERLETQKTQIDQHGQLSGLVVAEQANLQALTQAQIDQVRLMQEAVAEMNLDSSEAAEFSAFVQAAMNSNGLAELRQNQQTKTTSNISGRMQALALIPPEQVCDVLIPTLCKIKTVVNDGGRYAEIASATCTAVAVGLVAGRITAKFAIVWYTRICVPVNVANKVLTVAQFLFAPIDFRLHSYASATSLPLGGTADVKATVSVGGLSGVCQEVGKKGLGTALDALLKKRIYAQIGSSDPILRNLAAIMKLLGEDAVKFIIESVSKTVSNTLDLLKLSDMFGKLVAIQCAEATAGELIVPIARVFPDPPSDSGLLIKNVDGTGTYRCPIGGPPVFKTSVTLQGKLKLCADEPAETKQSFSCGTSQVTITMGDNGNALDDIFEVSINGETVLTSNQPVRQTSVTVTLPFGQTVITMRGLAAPDNVGTYFIQFQGARFVSGSALSGTDLTPGVEKTFTIEVANVNP